MESVRENMPLRATISGSFRKHHKQMRNKLKELERAGIVVLSPKDEDVARVERGFVILSGDKGTLGEIESSHLEAIERSDFLYVVDPQGYIGTSVAMEIGYALSRGLPVFTSHKPVDQVFASLTETQPSLEVIQHRLLGDPWPQDDLGLGARPTLREFQRYVAATISARGFEDETLRDVIVLLVEEVGELARAIRQETGLMDDAEKLKEDEAIALELADCLIYLLDIANLADVDMESAFRAKEAINKTKRWASKKAGS